MGANVRHLATMPYEMDAWGVDVDVTVAGAQKGLMTPPGFSFVAAGERTVGAHQSAGLRTFYWDWTEREGPLHYQKYCGTPPEHMMFGLRKALDMISEEGHEAIFTRHRILADAVRAAVAVWAGGGMLEFNITEADERADSVTTILMPGKRGPEPLIDYCNEQLGVILGIGIGEFTGKAFRIAHMGHINAPMVLGTLGAVETGLVALNFPDVWGGVKASVDSIAAAVSPDAG